MKNIDCIKILNVEYKSLFLYNSTWEVNYYNNNCLLIKKGCSTNKWKQFFSCKLPLKTIKICSQENCLVMFNSCQDYYHNYFQIEYLYLLMWIYILYIHAHTNTDIYVYIFRHTILFLT